MCKGLAALPASCLKSAKDIKHKIEILLHKPEQQPAEQKQQRDKNSPGKRAPSVEEVGRWKTSLSHLMSNEDGCEVFTDFLRSEFSQENMEFWKACQQYKKTQPPVMASSALEIYHQYIEADAPKEVNLDAATREEIKLKLENPSLSCFDEAQKKIYTLMEKDSYRRFLNSKLIQDLSQPPPVDTARDKKAKKNCPDIRRALSSCG